MESAIRPCGPSRGPCLTVRMSAPSLRLFTVDSHEAGISMLCTQAALHTLGFLASGDILFRKEKNSRSLVILETYAFHSRAATLQSLGKVLKKFPHCCQDRMDECQRLWHAAKESTAQELKLKVGRQCQTRCALTFGQAQLPHCRTPGIEQLETLNDKYTINIHRTMHGSLISIHGRRKSPPQRPGIGDAFPMWPDAAAACSAPPELSHLTDVPHVVRK